MHPLFILILFYTFKNGHRGSGSTENRVSTFHPVFPSEPDYKNQDRLHRAATWGLCKVYSSSQIRKERNSKYHLTCQWVYHDFLLPYAPSLNPIHCRRAQRTDREQAWRCPVALTHGAVKNSWCSESGGNPPPFFLCPVLLGHNPCNGSLQQWEPAGPFRPKGWKPSSVFGSAVALRRWVKPCQFLFSVLL